MFTKKHLAFSALLFLFLFLMTLFQWKLGGAWYSNNDGVTLSCASESIWRLFHPGLQSVWGCTYDHQPLYFFIVKLILNTLGHELIHFQLLNAIFLSLGLTLFIRELSKHVHWVYAVTVPIFLCSSWFVLGHLQEIRMYTTYLFSTLLLQTLALRYTRGIKPSLRSGLLHLAGYFNFFLYLIPMTFYLHLIRAEFKNRGPTFRLITALAALLLLIKLPFIIWWRVYMRSGETEFKQHGLIESFELLFYGHPSFLWIGTTLSFLAIIYHIAQYKKSSLSRLLLYHFSFTVLFLLVTKGLLKMHEVDFRYFLYLVPITATMIAFFLNSLKVKWPAFPIGLLLFILSFNNHKSMFRHVDPQSENKEAAEFYISLTESNHKIFYTEDKHFLQNYIGIFGQLENSLKTEFIELKNSKTESSLAEGHVIVTLISTEEDHEKWLKRDQYCYETTAFQKNFFSYQTLFSVSVPCEK